MRSSTAHMGALNPNLTFSTKGIIILGNKLLFYSVNNILHFHSIKSWKLSGQLLLETFVFSIRNFWFSEPFSFSVSQESQYVYFVYVFKAVYWLWLLGCGGKGNTHGGQVLHPTTWSHRVLLLHVADNQGPQVPGVGLGGCPGTFTSFLRPHPNTATLYGQRGQFHSYRAVQRMYQSRFLRFLEVWRIYPST